MADKSHLEVQAAAWRELAERAKRLAGGLLDGPDRDRLLDYSAELDQKAAALTAGIASEKTASATPQQPPELTKSSNPEIKD
jgi:hypothetical protein